MAGSRSQTYWPVRGPWGSPSSGRNAVSLMVAVRFSPGAGLPGSLTMSKSLWIWPVARSVGSTECSAVKSKFTVPEFSTSAGALPLRVMAPSITLTKSPVDLMSSSKA